MALQCEINDSLVCQANLNFNMFLSYSASQIEVVETSCLIQQSVLNLIETHMQWKLNKCLSISLKQCFWAREQNNFLSFFLPSLFPSSLPPFLPVTFPKSFPYEFLRISEAALLMSSSPLYYALKEIYGKWSLLSTSDFRYSPKQCPGFCLVLSYTT